MKLSITKSDMSDTINDISKFLTFVIITHLLAYFINSSTNELFGVKILQLLFYGTIALMLYHFFVKPLLLKFINHKIDN